MFKLSLAPLGSSSVHPTRFSDKLLSQDLKKKKDTDLALALRKRFSFLPHINFIVSPKNRKKDSERAMGNL